MVEVELPPLAIFHLVSRILTLAEAGAYHAPYLDRPGEYGPDVRSRVELGQYVLARDYLLAQRLRTILCRQTAAVMETVQALATPPMPIPAPPVGQRLWTYPDGALEPVADAMLRFTAPFNGTGQPAISLPGGIQLAGPVHGEESLLSIASALESAL